MKAKTQHSCRPGPWASPIQEEIMTGRPFTVASPGTIQPIQGLLTQSLGTLSNSFGLFVYRPWTLCMMDALGTGK